MKRNVFLILAVAGLAACSGGRSSAGGRPAPAEGATVATENPCLDETLLMLRRKVPRTLTTTEERELRERNDACAEYRLAQRRSGARITAADYEREVLPWLFGIALFTGTLYLFTK